MSCDLPSDSGMVRPLVSILLPNLNTYPFLASRIQSIFAQTYENWELIIGDSYSTDGAWEFLAEVARKNPDKVTAFQIPKGLYRGWDLCLERARGKYVYIATSDDGMRPDCLEKMVAALEAHPDCDICDSLLQMIDENDRDIPFDSPEYFVKRAHIDFPLDRPHKRLAPHDFILHLSGQTVYTSITQVLIRRTVFEKYGDFAVDVGSNADLLWAMRISQHCNVCFVPEKLSSWRRYPGQATQQKKHLLARLLAWDFSPVVRRSTHPAVFIVDELTKCSVLLPEEREKNLLYYQWLCFFLNCRPAAGWRLCTLLKKTVLHPWYMLWAVGFVLCFAVRCRFAVYRILGEYVKRYACKRPIKEYIIPEDGNMQN